MTKLNLKPNTAEWFESAMNATTDMILIKGPASRVAWANQAFLTYYGMSAEEMQDIIDADHNDPDDTLQYVIDDKTVFDTGKPLRIPRETVTDAKGNAKEFYTIKSPIFEDGEVVRSIVICRPLEQPGLQTRAIGHQDAKDFVAPLKTLTRNFPKPMVMLDVQKRVINTSDMWERCFGVPVLSNNTFFGETYPNLDAVQTEIDHCMEAQKATQVTITISDSGSKSCTYLMEISPWSIQEGISGGVIVVATDVTDLYAKTIALQEANDDLAQFSYRASHDLKGPLSTTKGLAQFIVEDVEAGDLAEAGSNAKRIVSTMEGLERTVAAVLELAHAEVKESIAEPVGLDDLLSDICSGLSKSIRESNIDVSGDFEIKTINAQPIRIRQIMENLVSNGVKYCSKDVEDKYVRLRSRIEGQKLVLSVEDNGLGMPEGSEKTAFDMFTRFNADYEGSGLGLAIVKRHTDAMDGNVSITRTDTGTRFDVQLPHIAQ